jgi:alanine racemase
MAASTDVLRATQQMSLNAVDPGRLYFGLLDDGPITERVRFADALRSLTSRLIQVKVLDDDIRRPDPLVPVTPGMVVGLIPFGTADGLTSASAQEVLVRGRRAPIIEPGSLEHCRIDLSAVPDAEVGDEVVIIGVQDNERITLAQVAAYRGLANHEAVIALRESLPRVYVD